MKNFSVIENYRTTYGSLLDRKITAHMVPPICTTEPFNPSLNHLIVTLSQTQADWLITAAEGLVGTMV